MKLSAKKRNILIVALLLVLAAGLGVLLTSGNGEASGTVSDSGAISVHTTATTQTATTDKTKTSGGSDYVNGGSPAGTDDAAATDPDSSNSGDTGQAGQTSVPPGGGNSGSAQQQKINLKPGNVFFQAHQGNEYHHLLTGKPVEFEVTIQLWIPGNNQQILTIEQPTSVYVTYCKSPGGAKQTVKLNHLKNDQGSSWWVTPIPTLAPGNYQVEVYPGNPTPMVMMPATFTINNN